MTARPGLAALVLTLAAGAGAHGAQAGDGWSIAEAGPDIPPAVPVSLAPDGRALAAGSDCDETACSTLLTTHAPGGPFLPAGRVPGRLQASTPLRAGAALVVTSPLSSRGLTAFEVTSAGRPAGSAVLERRHATAAVAASDRHGTTAVAWLTSITPRQLRVRVRRRDGGTFSPARAVASFRRAEAFGGAAVAVGPRGEVAVLWASGGALHVRVLRPGARRFDPALRAGPSDRVARIAAAYTTGGTLAAIWSSADGGEEQNRAAVVRVSALRPGATRFSRHVRLGEGAGRETLLLAAGTAVRAVAAGRTANVAWTSRSLRVRLGTVHADGRVSAVRSLDARGVLADAVGSMTGRALIAWTHDPLGPDAGARAVLRATPERLGAIEPAGPTGSRATGAALDDRATRALVSWSAGDPVLSSRWGIAERRAP
ncbi:MAG TPA: hypothetical protein VFN44_23165 [Solirubrobacteraceae bacterium]|nr:hypothetical protein [Solirubrobacteraceae bacterium]